MKYWLLLTGLLMFSMASRSQEKKASVRYDGVYMSDVIVDKAGDTTYQYIRFYPKGQVITASSTDAPDKLRKWFNLQTKGVSKGTYAISGDDLAFSSTWSDVTVEYNGTIVLQENLKLHSKSLKTANESQRLYHFVRIKKLK